jgi:ribonuclease P protein component
MHGDPGPSAAASPVPAASGAGNAGDGGDDRAGRGGGGMGQPAPARFESRGEGLPARSRLRRSGDYLRCYRTGRRRTATLLMLYFAPNALGYPRLGVTASRKVGNSVTRHRLKRRIKEIYRRWPRRNELAALDLVVHLKPEAGGAGFSAVAGDLLGLLAGLAGRSGGAGRAADQGTRTR